MRRCVLLVAVLVLLVGCGVHQTVSHHTVSHADDTFVETQFGRTIQLENWKLTCGNQTFEIPHERCTIKIVSKKNNVQIYVDDDLIHEE